MSQSKPLTFGELKVGEYFISFPADGDDSGHGGYRRGSYLFVKIEPVPELGVAQNALRVCDNVLSFMPDTMQVLKILR